LLLNAVQGAPGGDAEDWLLAAAKFNAALGHTNTLSEYRTCVDNMMLIDSVVLRLHAGGIFSNPERLARELTALTPDLSAAFGRVMAHHEPARFFIDYVIAGGDGKRHSSWSPPPIGRGGVENAVAIFDVLAESNRVLSGAVDTK
jgi:hypothetical protein